MATKQPKTSCEADATKKGRRMRVGREGKGRGGLTIFLCFGRSRNWAGQACCMEPKQERPARTVRAREIALHLGILARVCGPMKSALSRQAPGARLEFLRWCLTKSGSNLGPAQSESRGRRPASPPVPSFQASGVDYPISCDFLVHASSRSLRVFLSEIALVQAPAGNLPLGGWGYYASHAKLLSSSPSPASPQDSLAIDLGQSFQCSVVWEGGGSGCMLEIDDGG